MNKFKFTFSGKTHTFENHHDIARKIDNLLTDLWENNYLFEGWDDEPKQSVAYYMDAIEAFNESAIWTMNTGDKIVFENYDGDIFILECLDNISTTQIDIIQTAKLSDDIMNRDNLEVRFSGHFEINQTLSLLGTNAETLENELDIIIYGLATVIEHGGFVEVWLLDGYYTHSNAYLIVSPNSEPVRCLKNWQIDIINHSTFTGSKYRVMVNFNQLPWLNKALTEFKEKHGFVHAQIFGYIANMVGITENAQQFYNMLYREIKEHEHDNYDFCVARSPLRQRLYNNRRKLKQMNNETLAIYTLKHWFVDMYKFIADNIPQGWH